jgi:hypothetical protein
MSDMSDEDFKRKVDNLQGYNDRYRNIAYLTKDELKTTTRDARIEDSKILIEQQRVLLAVTGITAATFLISALILGKM